MGSLRRRGGTVHGQRGGKRGEWQRRWHTWCKGGGTRRGVRSCDAHPASGLSAGTRAQALYRRAQAHLCIPPERHINGLQLALDDLEHALDADPQNAEVRKELKRAKEIQKKTDKKAMGMYTKMIGTGTEV